MLCGAEGVRAIDSFNMDMIDWTYRFCQLITILIG